MRDEQLGVQITFADRPDAGANRAAAELRRLLIEQLDEHIEASIDKEDADSQDAGSTLVLLFGTSAAVAIAEGIRAFLAKRPAQRDGFRIRTIDGVEVVATGEAASKLDATALVDALNRARRRPKR